jgi:glycosyltransferase involved in cell wall biosynthesis
VNILVAHSGYLSGIVSGENRVVEDESRLLREAGHQVLKWVPKASVSSRAAQGRTAIRAIWNREPGRRLAAARSEGLDVVHVHNLFPMLSPAVLRQGNAPVVMTLHNYRLMCAAGTFLRDGRICEDCMGRLPWPAVVHGCYQGSNVGSAVIATSMVVHRWAGSFEGPALYLPVSKFVQEKHIEGGWPAEQMRVKRNFTWPRRRREGAGTYFLYVGRLSVEKDVASLISLGQKTGLRILIAGDGPERDRLKSSGSPGIELLGPVSPERVTELMTEARALLFPSLSYEGSPRSVLEAYAGGVPVIASDIGALREVVRHGETGLLVPPKQLQGWQEAISRLMDDAESERMGEESYKEWQDKYTPEVGLRKLEDAYREAIGIGGGIRKRTPSVKGSRPCLGSFEQEDATRGSTRDVR